MAKFVPQSEMPLSDQVKVRREKLENLRSEGFDPFVQTRFEVTSDSAAIKANYDAMEGQSSGGPSHEQAGHGQGVLL